MNAEKTEPESPDRAPTIAASLKKINFLIFSKTKAETAPATNGIKQRIGRNNSERVSLFKRRDRIEGVMKNNTIISPPTRIEIKYSKIVFNKLF